MKTPDQEAYERSFQRDALKIALKQFERAALYDEQYKVIQESEKDEALAKEIAGRIGITPEMYKQVLSHAKK